MLILLQLLLTLVAFAHLERVPSEKPLLEYGIFAAGGYVPYYPASNQGRMRYVGAPIVRYRGLQLRSDEEDSMKARLFRNPIYGLDVSFGGAFTANSNDIDARKGMPDLDWVAEIGPRFYFFLIKTDKVWWRVNFPLRGAFSTDVIHWTYQGLVLAPSTTVRFFFDSSKYNSLILGLTRTYTTSQLQEYYFEVDAKYATASRPAYQAKAGYMSSNFGVGYIHEAGQWGYYAGWEINSYKGSANSASPLHKADYNQAWFAGVSYFFFQSEERGYQ